MADSPVCFTVRTNIISSNPSPHMVVLFFIGSCTPTSTMSNEGEERGRDNNSDISITKESIKLDGTSNLF